MIEGFFSAAGMLLIMIGILFLCWFCTKKIAGVSTFKGTGGRIRLLDQAALGQDKGVALIQVGDRYWLLGVASENINVLAELDEDALGEPMTPDSPAVPDFKQILTSLKDRKR